MDVKNEILLMETGVTTLVLFLLIALLQQSWNEWEFDYLHQLSIILTL